MKKIIVLTGVVIYTLFAVSTFTAVETEKNGDNMQFVATEKSTDKSHTDYEKYILTEQNGVIVVKNGRGEVVIKTDTQASILPKQDRKRLIKGIEVQNKRQLDRLLEDFCS